MKGPECLVKEFRLKRECKPPMRFFKEVLRNQNWSLAYKCNDSVLVELGGAELGVKETYRKAVRTHWLALSLPSTAGMLETPPRLSHDPLIPTFYLSCYIVVRWLTWTWATGTETRQVWGQLRGLGRGLKVVKSSKKQRKRLQCFKCRRKRTNMRCRKEEMANNLTKRWKRQLCQGLNPISTY